MWVVWQKGREGVVGILALLKLCDFCGIVSCLSCTNVQLNHEILLLKNELKGMSEVHDMCAALTTEVSSLRKALNSLKETKAVSSSSS